MNIEHKFKGIIYLIVWSGLDKEVHVNARFVHYLIKYQSFQRVFGVTDLDRV